ncbi:hypothetical protein ABPG74_004712 [Tetrahymena malaccensis]
MTKFKSKDLFQIKSSNRAIYSLFLIAILYLPTIQAFHKSRISADETEPTQFPSFNIKLKFVTQHFAPVQNCSIKITVDSDSYEATHDVNGLVALKGSFKRQVTDDTVPIQIEISSGQGENILANTITKDLTKSTTNASEYDLNDQIIYHPNIPKEAHLKGTVQNEEGQGIANAKLSISIDYPVFQDFLTVYTGESGQFDVVMYLEQLNPIYGNLSIEADGYLPWNIKKDTQYTQGFYIVDHLYFEFEKPIVLKKGSVNLNLEVDVVEHSTNKPYSGSAVNVSCQSGSNSSHVKQYQLGNTGDDGKVIFQDSTEFSQEEKIICVITASPAVNSNNLYGSTATVNFLRQNQFKVDPVIVYITTEPIKGTITGIFQSSVDNSAIPNLLVSFAQTSAVKALADPVQTDSNGKFTILVTGFKNEGKYEGSIVYTSDIYDPGFKYPLVITEDKFYSEDVGILKATLKPVPVTINVTGTLLEKTLKTPLAEYDIVITISYSSNKNTDTIPLKTDSNGLFSHQFQGQNTENYVITIAAQASEEFQELSLKRELGPNKASLFDADFKQVQVSRVQTYGLIIGYLYDINTNKPLTEGRISVIADKPFPEQNMKCAFKDNGNFRCDFSVEKYLTYNSQIQIDTDYGMSAKTDVGQLNRQNNYTITGLKSGVKFEIIPQQGLISGTLYNGETNQVLTEGSYTIISIDPAIENQDTIVNKAVKINNDGTFKIQLNLHLGPSYTIKVKFASNPLPESEQVFLLNYKNKYTIENLQINLGMQLNGLFSGQVITKQFIPVQNAIIKVFIDNIPNPFTGSTDVKGHFTIKVPSPTTQDVLNAKITVDKEKFKQYSDTIQFTKENSFQVTNYKITLAGDWWKSSFSGKIIDENNLPVPFCSLSLVLKDSFKEPTTPLPYTTVSVLSGDYLFTIEVNYDDDYMSYLSIKCNNFIDRIEPIKLGNQNLYKIENRISKMERKHIMLSFSGSVLNSISEPVAGISIQLTFDYESHTHGIHDMGEGFNKNGSFNFMQKVLMGYNYKANVQIQLPKQAIDADYQTYSFDLQFNDSNNYKIHKEIEIKKSLTDCLISGVILDADTKAPLTGAQAILHFTQSDFSDYSLFVYANEQGQFEIKTQIQEGFFYVAKAEGKKQNYKDNSVDIILSVENKFSITGIQILLSKAADTDYTNGFIHGHGLSITGDPIAQSNVVAYSEVDPSVKYQATTDANGFFALPDLRLVTGNVYAFVVELQPADANFDKKQRRIHLSVNDNYQYNNLTLAAERLRVKYTIKGKINDKNSGLVLGGTYITVSFISQRFIDNSYTYSNQEGEFTLTGTVAKGLNYDGKLVFIHAGYETLTPQITLQYDANAASNDAFYSKNDANYQLAMNPFQKLYYVDERNTIPIKSKAYEKTTCKLFPNKYLPFVKVSLYFEGQKGQDGTLVAQTYTDIKGNFVIYAPRPLFSDLQSYLVFERNGYIQLKEFQRITPNAYYIEQGPHQISNKSGVSDCSKKQRKIQNKYDKV